MSTITRPSALGMLDAVVYDMLWAKGDCLAGKLDFVQKLPLKRHFWGNKSRHLLTLGGTGGQIFDTRSTFGVPLKTLGHNSSNELWKVGDIKIKTAAGRRIISPGGHSLSHTEIGEILFF